MLVNPEQLRRFETADVIFVAQDGFTLAPARVRCYSFAKLLNSKGLRAEVLSFVDHLGAADQGGSVLGVPDDEKIRLNIAAFDILARNPRALLYVQKTGYHVLACLLAAGRNGNRLVLDYDDYELENQPFPRLEPWLPSLTSDRLLPAIAERAQACVVSSRRILDLVGPHNPNTHLIHTVADQEVFHPRGREEPRERFGEAVNILWCGDVWGHIPMKDLVLGIDAFALVPDRIRRKARFHVIGFGRAWEELKRRMRQRHDGLEALVFHDFIPPAEMPDVLREMDIGILPYHRNAFNLAKSPTKMFEYMLAKVAVCATPVGEVTHCLEDGRSVLLGDGLQGLSGQLARLIEDDDLRRSLAEAAYEHAITEYSLQGVAGRLAEVVTGAMAGRMDRTRDAVGEPLDAWVGRALGRTLPVAPRELLLARRDLHALAKAPDLEAEDPRRWSAPLLALLDWPGLARAEGIPVERIAVLRDAGARLRTAARLRPRLQLPHADRPPGSPRFNKLAAAEDWDDPAWFTQARRFKSNCASFPASPARDAVDHEHLAFGEALDLVGNFFKRSRGAWERIHLLYGLDRLGLLNDAARMVVACTDPDGFYLLLSELVGTVSVIDLGEGAPDRASHALRGEPDLWLLKPRPFRRDRLTVHHGALTPGVFAEGPHDAVVVPQNTVLRSHPPTLLRWAVSRLRMGGVLAFSTEVRLDDGHDVPGLAASALECFTGVLCRSAGLEPLDGFDVSLSDATLDRLAVAGPDGLDSPNFVASTGQTLHTTAVWFCRKVAEVPDDAWDGLADMCG